MDVRCVSVGATFCKHEQIAWRQRVCAEAADLHIEAALLEPERDVEHEPELERATKGMAHEFEAPHLRAALPADRFPVWPCDVGGQCHVLACGKLATEGFETVSAPGCSDRPEWAWRLAFDRVAQLDRRRGATPIPAGPCILAR